MRLGTLARILRLLMVKVHQLIRCVKLTSKEFQFYTPERPVELASPGLPRRYVPFTVEYEMHEADKLNGNRTKVCNQVTSSLKSLKFAWINYRFNKIKVHVC